MIDMERAKAKAKAGFSGYKFKWFSEDELLAMLPPVFIIDGFVPENAVAILYGKWGSYKSFLTLDMSHAITTGRDFHGRKTKQGAVAYLAGEGAGGLGKRLRALRTEYGTNKSPFWLNRDPFDLSDEDPEGNDTDRLIADLGRLKREHGIDFRLLIIDTLSRSVRGDETADVFSAAGRNAEKIRRAMGEGASVVLVHHAGKDRSRGVRGSSTLDSNADAVLAMDVLEKSREVATGKKTAKVKLTVEKLKDEEDGDEYTFVTKDVVSYRDDIQKHEASVILELVAINDEAGGTEADKQQADLMTIAVDFYGKMQAADSPAMQLPLSAACKALGIGPAGQSFDRIRLTITGRWQTVMMTDNTKVRLKLGKKAGLSKDKIIIESVEEEDNDNC